MEFVSPSLVVTFKHNNIERFLHLSKDDRWIINVFRAWIWMLYIMFICCVVVGSRYLCGRSIIVRLCNIIQLKKLNVIDHWLKYFGNGFIFEIKFYYHGQMNNTHIYIPGSIISKIKTLKYYIKYIICNILNLSIA